MITVRVSLPDEFPEMVREFREDICRCSGSAPVTVEVDSIPYALYLFAFTEDDPIPAGMLEFLFLNEVYRRGQCPRIGGAVIQSGISPIEDVIHVRSLAVRQTKQNSRVLTVLCQSVVDLATSLEARCLTAASSAGNERSASLQRNLGMKKLATMDADGHEIELSYLDLSEARERTRVWRRHRPVVQASPALRESGWMAPGRAEIDGFPSGPQEFRINRKVAV